MTERAKPRNLNVTIRDVASELDLSITTVSRALSGYDDVGAKTRERVIKTAKSMGYRPNRNAQRLVTRRTNVLAWVQSDNDNVHVDPHFVEVLSGVLRGARACSYDVILSSDMPDRQIAVYDRYVRDNSVDGFFIDLPQPDDARISFLLEAERPFIVHGRDPRSDRYWWIDIDNFGNYRTLTRLMIGNGHKRIAFINGDEQYMFAVERRRGVEAALDELGLPRETVRIYNTAHPMNQVGLNLTRRAIEEFAPTALIFSSVMVTLAARPAWDREGLVPGGGQLAIATMDDCLRYVDIGPLAGRVSFARSSLAEAGELLAKELVGACEAGKPPHGVMVPTRFELADGMDPAMIGDVELITRD